MTQRSPITTQRISVQHFPFSIFCPATAGHSLYVGQNIYNFERTDPFTFEFYIFPAAIGANANIFAECDNITPFKGLVIRMTSPNLLMKLINTISTNEAQAGWAAPPVGEYTHCLLSSDGSGLTAGLRAFFNGRLRPQTVNTPNNLSASILAPAGEETRWGAFSGGSNGVNSHIIPRRVLDYAVTTEAEAMHIYKTGQLLGAPALDEYPCDEGSGPTVRSIGVLGNDLTLVGASTAWSTRSPCKARERILRPRIPIS